MNQKLKRILIFSSLVLFASCATETPNSSVTTSSDESDVYDSNSNITTNDISYTSSFIEDTTSSFNEEVTSSNNETSSSTPNSSSHKVTIDEEILNYGTYVEAVYGEFNDSDASLCRVEYKASSSSTYTTLDQELIRNIGNGLVRFDAVGLKAGKYDFRIITSNSNVLHMDEINVGAADRSGYAFYNTTEGIGAYNQDGTLKNDAVVIYVTEETKNTVTANSKIGVGEIIKANNDKPLCVRFIGRVTSDTRNADGQYQGIYEKINGLSDYPTDDGTYYNELDIENCKNITLEGIGNDAEIFQWGVQFLTCSSIEVKNLTFTDYTEDACGVFGDLTNPSKCQRYFIHNNHFNVGKNLLNDTPEKDKGKGDGATDVKGVSYVTYAYNSFLGTRKTGLVGGSDSDKTSHLTYHHNYYKNCYSRIPLGRNANMHYYNNFIDGTESSCMDLRKAAYVFSEANYYNNCKNPVKVKDNSAVKSYNDIFANCKNTNSATIVSNREATVSNNCEYGQNFDTDPNNFYYDSINKVSNVTYLTDAEQAKLDALNYSGPGHINPTYTFKEDKPTNPNPSTSSSQNSSANPSSSSSSTSSFTTVIPSGEAVLFNASELDNGTYTSTFTSGMFTITCNSGSNVTVYEKDYFTSINPNFTKVLKLGGSGKKDYRSVVFELFQDAQVKVYAKSYSGKKLEIDEYNSDSAVVQADLTETPIVTDNVLNAGKYYVRSTGSSIEIAAIEINYL